ncbi:hypothetical protein C8F01DRAFT_1090639 [Mycena amicta]|nr:hypothetical protein C8F01DRAFT_1090639 [Mycena amicta]
MIYSTRAVVPPKGFVPYSGRRVAITSPPSLFSPSSPVATHRRSSVVKLLPTVVVSAQAEPLCRQAAKLGLQNSNSVMSPSYYLDLAVKAMAKGMGGVPMCRQ